MEQADDPFAELKEKFVPTFARSCLFWLPAQTINFYWVPPKFRIVYIGTCSLIWANILCWIKRQNGGAIELGADGSNDQFVKNLI